MTRAIPKRKAGERPTLVLGAMNFGKRTAPDESERIVRRALERGIRSFDTANIYNAGESERILGRALAGDRDLAVVATKAGLGIVPGKPEGLSPAALDRQLRASLERLRLDAVDLYYLHVPDRTTPIEQTLDGMQALVESGRVRAWGVSNYAAWEVLEMNALADARGLPRPVATQLLYNAIHRQLDVEYFAFTRRHTIATVTYNALAGGLLTGQHRFSAAPDKGSRFDANPIYQRRYWTRAMFERVEQLREVAEREGCSLVDLAYAWVASRADVDAVLVGPASVDQLDRAIDAVARTLSPGALARIDELSREWSGTDTNYVR
jgi:aryl-alcohol dehydrogenase-like predicted oxidoreductase